MQIDGNMYKGDGQTDGRMHHRRMEVERHIHARPCPIHAACHAPMRFLISRASATHTAARLAAGPWGTVSGVASRRWRDPVAPPRTYHRAHARVPCPCVCRARAGETATPSLRPEPRCAARTRNKSGPGAHGTTHADTGCGGRTARPRARTRACVPGASCRCLSGGSCSYCRDLEIDRCRRINGYMAQIGRLGYAFPAERRKETRCELKANKPSITRVL